MYIEPWQFYIVFTAMISAFFSYRQGRLDGVKSGVEVTIVDLHNRGIIAIHNDSQAGSLIVGRYDEKQWDESTLLEKYENDDE